MEYFLAGLVSKYLQITFFMTERLKYRCDHSLQASTNCTSLHTINSVEIVLTNGVPLSGYKERTPVTHQSIILVYLIISSETFWPTTQLNVTQSYHWNFCLAIKLGQFSLGILC